MKYPRKFVPYKSYVANLTQTGTGAPVATVLENNLGNNLAAQAIVWTRTSAGLYIGTLAGKFLVGKTTVRISNPVLANLSTVQAKRASDNTIQIDTAATSVSETSNVNTIVSTPTDAILGSIPHQIEIRVYD